MNLNDERLKLIFKIWEKGVNEEVQIRFSNHIETVLLYLCALNGTVSDEFLDYINFFAYPKFTKEEIEGVVRIINSYGSNMNFMVPSFFLRMIHSDIDKIVNRTFPKTDISKDNGIQISVDFNQEIEDEIQLETLTAIFMLTEAVATGFDINHYATHKSEIFLSNFKTFINGLLETYKNYRWYDVLFVKEGKEIIVERINELNFDEHDNNVEILDEEIDDIKDDIESLGENLFYKHYLSWYIQANLIYLWSTNERFSREMFQYFNIFRGYQFNDDEILGAMEIMREEENSFILPFDFMYYINLDLHNNTSSTRYYISLLQMIFIFGARILNSLSLEVINIIEQAIKSLRKLCDNNNVEYTETIEQLDEMASDFWKFLCEEIEELEKNNNGIYEERKNIIKENVEEMFYNIIDYIVEIGCITEEDVEKYLTFMAYKDENEIIQKILKDNLKNAEADVKQKIIKYVQKYVKRCYNEGEGSDRKAFIEDVLYELESIE